MQNVTNQTIKTFAAACMAATLLTGCGDTLDRLKDAGRRPPLEEVRNPTASPAYQPLTWPMPPSQPPVQQAANSLWQPNARAFFRDQRAGRVGDILKVSIKISDKAQVDNNTDSNRTNTENVGAGTIFGVQNRLFGWLPGKAEPANLIGITGDSTSKGKGKIDRKEDITTQVAALITQVLPNGNFVIDGKQEIRVNSEIREVSVAGVIRPEDIKSDNTIDSNQIAEARITYGGRGQLTDIQRPRWGQQVVDVLSPF